MEKKKLIKIQGSWYILHGMYGGSFHAGSLFDLDNGIIKDGIIWEQQPFLYEHEFWYGKILHNTVKNLRIIKQFFVGDVFGRRFEKINIL